MRPTTLIRRMLQLEMIEAEVSRQIRSLRHLLEQEGITVVDRKDREMDIWIQYRWDNRVHEALYMKPMLKAELPFLTSKLVGEKNR